MEFLHQYNEFDEAILQRRYNYFKGKPGKSVIETRVKLMTLMPSRVQVNCELQPRTGKLGFPQGTRRHLNRTLSGKIPHQSSTSHLYGRPFPDLVKVKPSICHSS